MVNVPDDIILEILVRLPAKSIGRFRCLNKAWYKFLKHPKFVKMQFNHVTETNKLNFLLCSRRFENKNNYKLYSVSYDVSSSTCGARVSVGYPLIPAASGIKFYGYCNGLVCTSHDLVTLTLWNPCTKEYQKLPPVQATSNAGYLEYGFGYDNKMEVFKVVSLLGRKNPSYCEVRVYTLGSSDMWKKLENISYDVSANPYVPAASRVTVNGATHWIAKPASTATEVIISFDFEKEIFQEIPLPNLSYETTFAKYLCVLGGCLCFAVANKPPTCSLDVWELKDYEVGNSWSKIFTIGDPGFGIFSAMPLLMLKNGEVLFGIDQEKFFDKFTLVLHNPKCEVGRGRSVHGDKLVYFRTTAVYVESLISLGSGTFLGQLTPQGSSDDDDDDEVNEEEEAEGEENQENMRIVRTSSHISSLISRCLQFFKVI